MPPLLLFLRDQYADERIYRLSVVRSAKQTHKADQADGENGDYEEVVETLSRNCIVLHRLL